MTNPPPGSVGLFLRDDGTLMVARGETTLQMHLAPAQLIQIGIDALRVAVAIEPRCLPEVLAALETCEVQVPPDFAEGAPCQLN